MANQKVSSKEREANYKRVARNNKNQKSRSSSNSNSNFNNNNNNNNKKQVHSPVEERLINKRLVRMRSQPRREVRLVNSHRRPKLS